MFFACSCSTLQLLRADRSATVILNHVDITMKTHNFRMKRPLASLALAALLVAGATAASAAPIEVESGDAGELTGTAQSFNGTASLDAVRGSLLTTSNLDYADLFRIYLTAGQSFSATTTGSGIAYNNFDTGLFLFNGAGLGLLANDDDPNVGPSSSIANYAPAASGFYYLAIAGAGYTPLSAGGAIFGSLLGLDQVGPAGPGGALPLAAWSSVSSEGGAYEIQLQGALVGVVPEPSSWAMLALGLCAVAAARRRAPGAPPAAV
jgi:hypothetical protein